MVTGRVGGVATRPGRLLDRTACFNGRKRKQYVLTLTDRVLRNGTETGYHAFNERSGDRARCRVDCAW